MPRWTNPSRILGMLVGGALLALAAASPGCIRQETGGVPESVARWNALGTAYLSRQEWDRAQDAFARALEERPNDPVLLVNLAVALMQQAREDEAEAYLKRALEADPGNLHAHYNLGLIYKNRGEMEAARDHFRKVVEADPSDVSARYNLASVLARLGEYAEAERHYRAALERNPTHVSSLYALGRLLLQTGREEEGRELIERSQRIRASSGVDAAVGNQYGEQGPYAMAVDYTGEHLQAPPPAPVRFGEPEPLAEAAKVDPAHAAAFDTGEPSPALAWASGREVSVRLPDGSVSSAPLPPGLGALALGAADLDGDGGAELVVLARREEDGSAWLARRPAAGGEWSAGPLEALDGAVSGRLLAVDRDHDGDLDLLACAAWDGGARCALRDNDGAGVLSAPGTDPGLDLRGSREVRGLSLGDVDNDRDVDLWVLTEQGLSVFDNRRDGTFRRIEDAALDAGTRDAAAFDVADVNQDGRMDVVALRDGIVLLVNRPGGFVAVEDVPRPARRGGASAVRAADLDNDGFLDLVAGAGAALRNLGRLRFEDAGARWLPGDEGDAVLDVLDVDGDGNLDLVTTDLAVRRNEGADRHHWVRIRPQGVRDNRFGIGTKVEVLAGALRQKFEVTRPLPVHAGLGPRDLVDAVRFLWPGGVLQDELNLQADDTLEIAQLDRKGTSCPILYVWRDDAWRFVTDFLGGSAVGYQLAPGVFNTPDPDETILLDPAPQVVDGQVRLRLNNQLEEVIWFDEAALLAVDHPEGSVVVPDEALMPGPPWRPFRLLASRDVRPVARAVEVESRRDVTDVLARRDRVYADGFRLLPFKGYAETHTLELDLGALPPSGRVVLLLDGWIDYADSSSNIAAAQAGLALEPPALLTPDGDGGWKLATRRLGFPAGLPKPMTAEITAWVRRDDPRVRIRTNMRIYWDRAQVLIGGEDLPVEVRRIAPDAAELRFGGFPAPASPDARPPFGYDPSRVATQAPWKTHAGGYTPFGDVRALLAAADNAFVATRNGDEVELRFPAPPPPPPGWTRTWMLHAVGFGKDMDPNSLASERVEPLPFHGMPGYPYGPEVPAPPIRITLDGRIRWVPPDPRGIPGAPPLVPGP